MTDTVNYHYFGQDINPHRLSPLARRMASAIGNGTPASWAGFVWSTPQSRQHLLHPVEQLRPSRAA